MLLHWCIFCFQGQRAILSVCDNFKEFTIYKLEFEVVTTKKRVKISPPVVTTVVHNANFLVYVLIRPIVLLFSLL